LFIGIGDQIVSSLVQAGINAVAKMIAEFVIGTAASKVASFGIAGGGGGGELHVHVHAWDGEDAMRAVETPRFKEALVRSYRDLKRSRRID
jgi:hypothetical protein